MEMEMSKAFEDMWNENSHAEEGAAVGHLRNREDLYFYPEGFEIKLSSDAPWFKVKYKSKIVNSKRLDKQEEKYLTTASVTEIAVEYGVIKEVASFELISTKDQSVPKAKDGSPKGFIHDWLQKVLVDDAHFFIGEDDVLYMAKADKNLKKINLYKVSKDVVAS